MKMMSNNSRYKALFASRRKRIENFLSRHLNSITSGAPKRFIEATKYAILNGGKRIRPLLVYAVGDAYNVDLKILDNLACAVEFIHSFSLVHDDLPAMDNDDLRRGKPTCHLEFDEATAILVGDALSIEAFQIINRSSFLTAEKKVVANNILAEASGIKGMAAGQYIDLQALGKKLSPKKFEDMYILKTGYLMSAAVKLGALGSDSISKEELKYLSKFAIDIGLVFQIQDDILNIESSVEKLGKGIGTDKAANKITYPALVGVEAAKIRIEKLWNNAEKMICRLGFQDSALYYLSSQIMQRDF